MDKIKFIDLFAGIGGFHIAVSELGGECVFASEIDKYCLETYQKNFGIDANHDVTNIKPEDLPYYNMLCAGFPCQTFSKAGDQKGFGDTRGTLFFDIQRLLKYRIDIGDPVKYIVLENVRNLVSHDRGRTWKIIKNALLELGYVLTKEPIIMSPHQIGIPQLRERVFILGIHNKYYNDVYLDINVPNNSYHLRNGTNALDILDSGEVDKKYYISEYEEMVLTAWDEFIKGINQKVIGFPIWSYEFGKDYSLDGIPKWKQDFIIKNRKLYKDNKPFIDSWLVKYNYLDDFIPTHQKFEWQAGEDISSIWEGIIQFRPSGIRVKRPTEFPALVAMVHIPIIGKYKRRLTPREVARLQSFPETFIPHENDQQAYKQFGNSVNIDVVKYLVSKLLQY